MQEDKILKIINYVKTQLGHPVVVVEVTDEMIREFIFASVSRKNEVEGTIAYKEVPAIACQEFQAETIVRVYNNKLATIDPDDALFGSVIISNIGYSTNMRDILIQRAYTNYTSQLVECSFMYDGKYLYLDNLTGTVTVEYVPNLVEVPVDSISEDWIRRYTLALTKECLGRIRGKFTSQSSPFTTDHENLLNEANEEKQRLEDELLDRGSGFFFVDSD